jgi:hypothetical protein
MARILLHLRTPTKNLTATNRKLLLFPYTGVRAGSAQFL